MNVPLVPILRRGKKLSAMMQHARTLLFWSFLLCLCAALPPLTLPLSSSTSSTLQPFNNTTPLPQSFNHTTLSLSAPRTPTCYAPGHRSPPVDLLSCFGIIALLARSRGYEKRIPWRRNPRTGQAVNVRVGACRLQVLDGAAEDVFSVAEVVDVMEAVLEECQPEVRGEYGGTGGQMGVGRWGFVVRVVGVGEG